jgi:L-Ala-D/L-Glu epimerase
MPRTLVVRRETWPIKGSFRISRGAKTVADVVVVEVADGKAVGRGECVPYPRYSETPDGVVEQMESLSQDVINGLTCAELQSRLPAGAARNALDCALIDWEAKATGRRAAELLSLPPPVPVETAYTLSLDTPEAMAKAAGLAAQTYRTLKIKIGATRDLERVEAVRRAAPGSRLIADANEGWSISDLRRLAPDMARLGLALLEQPLKAEEDSALNGFDSPVPLCADESCRTRTDLGKLVGCYSHINIKLDKAGGLTEAIALAREARALGFRIMIGCMVCTSLSIAPAMLIAGSADFADLDGPLLLERDRVPSLISASGGEVIGPPARELWG